MISLLSLEPPHAAPAWRRMPVHHYGHAACLAQWVETCRSREQACCGTFQKVRILWNRFAAILWVSLCSFLGCTNWSAFLVLRLYSWRGKMSLVLRFCSNYPFNDMSWNLGQSLMSFHVMLRDSVQNVPCSMARLILLFILWGWDGDDSLKQVRGRAAPSIVHDD